MASFHFVHVFFRVTSFFHVTGNIGWSRLLETGFGHLRC